MDLALALGKTVGELEREMTGVEFNLWQRYAARRALPVRRAELYAAQIAMKIVQVMGSNTEVELSDFLFDPVEEDTGPVDNADDAAAFFGFAPRNVKE